METGILYIVPTPIGNLGDMTFRGVEILKKVSIIGAEDTRTSSKLLKHYDICTPMVSYHKFNERARVDKFLEKLKNGEDLAIISDAGTPGISDPSSIIIKAAIENNIKVVTLPGATAFIPALVSSGMSADRFYFVGFLPEKAKKKKDLLESLTSIKDTLIFYEAPHRIIKFLTSIRKDFGDRNIIIARELSKIHETFYRTSIDDILCNPEQLTLKGEFVIIVQGAIERSYSEKELIGLLQTEILKGETKKSAVAKIAQRTGVPKNKIYNIVLKL